MCTCALCVYGASLVHPAYFLGTSCMQPWCYTLGCILGVFAVHLMRIRGAFWKHPGHPDVHQGHIFDALWVHLGCFQGSIFFAPCVHPGCIFGACWLQRGRILCAAWMHRGCILDTPYFMVPNESLPAFAQFAHPVPYDDNDSNPTEAEFFRLKFIPP